MPRSTYRSNSPRCAPAIGSCTSSPNNRCDASAVVVVRAVMGSSRRVIPRSRSGDFMVRFCTNATPSQQAVSTTRCDCSRFRAWLSYLIGMGAPRFPRFSADRSPHAPAPTWDAASLDVETTHLFPPRKGVMSCGGFGLISVGFAGDSEGCSDDGGFTFGFGSEGCFDEDVCRCG